MPNNTLDSLPNIGKALAQKLKQAGINTIEELYNIGSENAFIRIHTLDSKACINMLFALEGAIQGIRWHNIDTKRKSELIEFISTLK